MTSTWISGVAIAFALAVMTTSAFLAPPPATVMAVALLAAATLPNPGD